MRSSIYLFFSLAVGALAGRAGLGAKYNNQRAPVLPTRRHMQEKSTGMEKRTVISPKFFIISLFSSEGDVWYENMPSLYDQNITVPGLSPLFPEAHCTSDGDVCQLIAGEGGYNAGNTISGLIYSDYFDLSLTYFMVAGIAGINPHVATTGAVTFSKYVTQVDLQYVFNAHQVPNTANASSGFFPQDSYYADEYAAIDYPGSIYGTEAFELSAALLDRFVTVAKTQNLSDSAAAQAYRATYGYAPANEPPSVKKCSSATSNIYWSGSVLGDAFTAYSYLITNGSATYCATQQEDSAVLEALLRGDLAGKVDFTRVAVMRTASDFDRAPADETELYHLLYAEQEGFEISIDNIFIAGNAIVQHVLEKWDATFKKGLKVDNYVGDLFNSLNSSFVPDIGVESSYINPPA